MTFIIRRNGKEVGTSESKVVSFSTPSEFKIGDIVPTATYTALNRNSFGDSPEVNVPSFEITNSDKPADIVASKITVTPGRTTAIIKDGTDRLTSTEDVLTAYDPDGKPVATSEGKTPEVQIKDLSSATTYQGYTIKWTNPHGSSSPALVPDFTTTSEPLEPISTDKLTMDIGTTTNKIQYLGTEDRSGQIFHVAKSISDTGQTANKAPWEVTLTDLDVNTKYPAGTWVVYFSKASAKTDPVPLPEFTTLDVPAPVAPKDGDISVSNIQQTTATVTDDNSNSVDRSAEQIKVFLDTDAKEWTGKTGELTISLDGLTANTNYNGRFTVGYYNPTTKKVSDKVAVPNFSTKDWLNPYDPVASDLTVSDITDTTAKVTDANSNGYDRTNEQIRVSKSGSTDDFSGVNGEFSITLNPLTPNTKYESNLWFHWYNPATGKASGNVAVPTFITTGPTLPPDPRPSYVTINGTSLTVKDNNNHTNPNHQLRILDNSNTVVATGNLGENLVTLTGLKENTSYYTGTYKLEWYDKSKDKSSSDVNMDLIHTSFDEIPAVEWDKVSLTLPVDNTQATISSTQTVPTGMILIAYGGKITNPNNYDQKTPRSYKTGDTINTGVLGLSWGVRYTTGEGHKYNFVKTITTNPNPIQL